AVGRDVEEVLRHEQRDEGHHLQVGLERAELVPHFGLAVGGGLIDRQLGRERRLLERIRFLARLLRRHIGGDHILTALDERLQHGLAERLLAVDHDTHEQNLPQPRLNSEKANSEWRVANRKAPPHLDTLLYPIRHSPFAIRPLTPLPLSRASPAE